MTPKDFPIGFVIGSFLGVMAAPLGLVRELPDKGSYRRRLMLAFIAECAFFYLVMGLV